MTKEINGEDIRSELKKQIEKNPPFSLLKDESLDIWIKESKLIRFKPGERIIEHDEINRFIYIIVKGSVRLIMNDETGDGLFTLDKRGSGQIIGWTNLLRGEPTEFVQASTDTIALALTSKLFIEYYKLNSDFARYFDELNNIQEAYIVARRAAENEAERPKGWEEELKERIKQAKTLSLQSGEELQRLSTLPEGWNWHLSTSRVMGKQVGDILNSKMNAIQVKEGFSMPIRIIALQDSNYIKHAQPKFLNEEIIEGGKEENLSLEQLGILESDKMRDDEKYPLIKGKGKLKEATAVCEMIARSYNLPFKKDMVKKIFEDQFRRGKDLTLDLIAGVCEVMGLNSQLATTNTNYATSIEGPVVLFLEKKCCVLYGKEKGKFVIANPNKGIKRYSLEEIKKEYPENIQFAILKRSTTSPTKKFGWHWFTPLLKKYKLSLFLVFVSSLLAQVFGLAIPLLIQQIIDKVLSQGNLSSLNVLGAAMVTMALFQGILQALRTYIFVDTTDRMDLTLGSSVIDRLLSLPLNFFEKRPIGELSQRIGELNNIRGFLTGTAMLTVLNLIFATLYLAVMFIYSPLLTGIALSTFPAYVVLVLVVSPLYKSLIRKRAVAAAKTQSHLIEVIGGIQTVKAQHFELTARWKWQDRYRNFVNEGFKSTALGSTAGEVGNFLNTVSSLLVLWVGMWLILKGEFTLGQLIAFRIISGNVTGPLLQLAGLYQGFQGVQLSMERLGDIINQQPELKRTEEIGQISLPPINGTIRFEDINFRFSESGPYQLENVSAEIESGSFVGIVGQSGSGKSTLMKLLPRLYNANSGRIFIDNYDINKVDLSSLRRQIGIVPQDSLLFEGTVADNIALNDPQATDEEIIEAAKIACAHEFIMSLNLGYATPLAEKGSNLSGGQRQRIAIARTILTNPRLLIMDEATSALDYDTERELCLNLQEWANDKTVLFITHRLSTIKNSDTIIVMHKGRLEEQGNHEELIRENGRYATLYRQQEASG